MMTCIQNLSRNTAVNENANQEVSENRQKDVNNEKNVQKRKKWMM